MNEVHITTNGHNQIEVYATKGEAIVSEVSTYHASKIEEARKAARSLSARYSASVNEDAEALATLTTY